MSLFTPALLFSKVAFSLTPEKLADLYIIPIGFVLITCFSAAVAFAMSKVFRLKRSQRNFASELKSSPRGTKIDHLAVLSVACTMFQNSNSLPIALMQSLIGEHMPLSWGPHDTKDSQLGRALSYLVLFSTLGIIVRWSIGVRLLTSAEAQDDEEDLAAASSTITSGDPFSDAARIEREQDEEARHYTNGSTSERERREREGLLSRGLEGGNGVENGVEGDGARGLAMGHKSSNVSEATTTTLNGGGSPKGSVKKTVSIKDGRSGALLSRDDDDDDAQPIISIDGKKKRRDRIFQSFPNTPIPSQYGGSEPSDPSDWEDDDDAEWGARRGVGRRSVDKNESWEKVKRVFGKVGRPMKRWGKKVGAFVSLHLR